MGANRIVTTIPLDRQFYEWHGDGDRLAHSQYRAAAGLSDGLLEWPELLAKRRVVILAEAGSGKTEELWGQARQLQAAAKFAFYATVQDVGRDGLEKALKPAERPRLEAWCKSTDPGWFFIDSIDEAKLDNIRLEKALRQIAEGIIGNEGRAHIVLSGRHTDWEFARDARRLAEELPLPHDKVAEPSPSLETLIQRVLRNEKPPEPAPAETPLIVVMAPLDAERVRAYATAKNVSELNGLIAAIEAANMWEFAQRPLDLDWIVRYWRSHGRLGNFTAMIETSLYERTQEADPDRARRDPLDTEHTIRGLERIGAALVFGRQTSIAIPDKDAPLEDTRTAVKIDDVLPDWSNKDRVHLLTRPAFDPATFGRARLHNDNEGVVRAYLGAAYSINAQGATDALGTKLDRLCEVEKTALVEQVLPQIFGSRWALSKPVITSLDIATLERLVVLAYRFVRMEEDHDRANKGVYSPDQRDEAEEARSTALNVLVGRPGAATFAAITRLIEAPQFPIPASRLRALAYDRASEDSEHTAWVAAEALGVEKQFERPPVTGRELQVVVEQRLEDLQHELIHGDFQQGTTLSALPDECAVQNWMADRLRQAQGSAYSIEREPHVAEEKEPDLRFRCKTSDAAVATEIKVAESWSLPELEEALVNQLCGQYLRAENGREGILLLVHQKTPPKGWKLPDGTFVSFDDVVQRLRTLAANIRSASSSGPQPTISVIDVSVCAGIVERRVASRKRLARVSPPSS